MRARAISRLVGAIAGMVLGIVYGSFILSNNPHAAISTNASEVRAALLAMGVAGAASISLAAPRISVDPFIWLQKTLEEAPPAELLGGVIGLIVALAISSLTAVLLADIPWGIGYLVSLGVAAVMIYVGVRTGTRRRGVFLEAFGQAPRLSSQSLGTERQQGSAMEEDHPIVLDTSALIDGRVLDVARTGFIQRHLLIPHFVLEETQQVADSSDPTRRARGRRGLDVAEALRNGKYVSCEVVDITFPDVADVDIMLLRLCRMRGASLLTQDYNLNRLAATDGIRVLNMNDLANALKPAAVSGEVMEVFVAKEGREPRQGVGYLEDGTMVVIEEGASYVNSVVPVQVVSFLQTPSGRMIFSSLYRAGMHSVPGAGVAEAVPGHVPEQGLPVGPQPPEAQVRPARRTSRRKPSGQ